MTMTPTAPSVTGTGLDAPGAPAKEKKSRKKLIVVVVLVLALAGGGYWFFLKPGGGPEAPVPGSVLVLEPVQVNLQDGHYLRIGLALQLTAGTAEADGSKALDASIALFSGRSVADLSKSGDRNRLKEQLRTSLEKLYEGEVMDVYFTNFVTQ